MGRRVRESILFLCLLLIIISSSTGCVNKFNQPVNKPIEPVSALNIKDETWPVYNTVLWKHKKKNPYPSSPLSYNNIIFSEDHRDIVALNRKTGKVLWRHDTNYCESNIIIIEDKLIFGSNDTHVYALDAKTGRVVWKFKTGYIVHMVNCGQGKVLVGGEGRKLFALELPTGKLAWQIDIPNGCDYSVSAISDDTIYFGNKFKDLYSIQISTGKINWKLKTDKSVSGSLTAWNNLLLFSQCGYEDKNYDIYHVICAYDVDSAREKWRSKSGGCISNRFIINQNQVIFYSGDGYLYSLDAQTGQCEWKKYLAISQGTSDPVLNNDTLFIDGGYDGRLYVLDTRDGKPKWVFDDIQNNQPLRDSLESIYTGKPLIIDSTIYFETGAGYLYAIPIVDE